MICCPVLHSIADNLAKNEATQIQIFMSEVCLYLNFLGKPS